MSPKPTAVADPQTALAPVAPPVTNALATRQSDGTKGKENLDTHDLVLPRLDIAQRTSAYIDPTADKFIPGAEFTHLVNSLRKETYGNGPVTVIFLGMPRKRGVQFDEDGKLVDRNVPLTTDPSTGEYLDERLQFTGPAEKRKKPVASLLYEFVGLIKVGDDLSLAMLTFKSTQVQAAKDLITLMAFRKGNVYDGQYTVSSVRKEFPKGPAGQFVVRPAGATSDADAAAAEVYYEMLQTKRVVADDDNLEADDTNDTKAPF